MRTMSYFYANVKGIIFCWEAVCRDSIPHGGPGVKGGMG